MAGIGKCHQKFRYELVFKPPDIDKAEQSSRLTNSHGWTVKAKWTYRAESIYKQLLELRDMIYDFLPKNETSITVSLQNIKLKQQYIAKGKVLLNWLPQKNKRFFCNWVATYLHRKSASCTRTIAIRKYNFVDKKRRTEKRLKCKNWNEKYVQRSTMWEAAQKKLE